MGACIRLLLVVFVTWTSTPHRVRAQDGTSRGDRIAARVPQQSEGRAWASLAAGVDFSLYVPLAESWSLPARDGGIAQGAPPRPLGALALRVGALHFYDHADLFVSIPVLALKATTASGASARLKHISVGGKIYPWALRPGTVRPSLSIAVAFRSLRIDRLGDDDATAVGTTHGVVVPLGVGLAWRTPWHVLVDAQAQYVVDSEVIQSDLSPQPLIESAEPSTAHFLDLSALTFTLSVSIDYDLTPHVTTPAFREEEIEELKRRIDNGSISTFNVAIGPSAQVSSVRSPYFTERRSYLRNRYAQSVFPHIQVGYYYFDWDAEIRLGYRGISGHAQAYGAELSTRQDAVFLEAVKYFDPDYRGFVPFVGVGVGYGKLTAGDTAAGTRHEHQASRALPSVVLGFDARLEPAAWWSLRTNLRWVPRAPIHMPGPGADVDLGGLQLDFIQFVLYPERMFR